MIDTALPAVHRSGWRPVALLSLGTLLSCICVYIYLPILPAYALSMGASLSLIGVISGAYGLSQFVLRIPAGLLSDRMQKRKLFVVGGAVCGILSCIGLGISSDPRTFVVWRCLAGIAVTTHVASTALYAAQFDDKHSSRAMGFYMATVTFAIAIGPLIGGWAAAEMGWRAPFFLGAAFGVISLLPLGAVRDTENVPVAFEIPLRTRLADLLRRPPILHATALGAVTAFAQFATTITFVPIRAVDLGADQVQLGLLLFVTMGTFSVVSLVSGNILAVRLGNQRMLILGLLLLTVTVLALPLIHNLLLLAVVQCVGSIGRGMYMPLVFSRSLGASSPSEHAAASGVVMTGVSFGVFVGPILTGLLADNFGLDWAFVCVGLVCAIATTVAIRQGRPSPFVAM